MYISQNYEQAMKHFDKAAKKGSPEAQYYIGLAYLSKEESIDWPYNLLMCISTDGLGKPRNVKNAVASFKLSAQSGICCLHVHVNVYIHVYTVFMYM